MKRIISILLVLMLILTALGISVLAVAENMDIMVGTYTGYVKTSNYGALNIRKEPSANAKKIGSIPYGKEVTIYLSFSGDPDWLCVEYKNVQGYVMARYIDQNKPQPKPTAKPTPKPTEPVEDLTRIFKGFENDGYTAIVRSSTPGSFVHMRWAPSKQMPIMLDYSDGSYLEVIAQNKTWCQVRDRETGETGFMMRQFLTQVIGEIDGLQP